MCRLMMFNRQFGYEHSEDEIAEAFTRLNNLQGGHGMGVFMSAPHNKLVKGLKVKGKDLARSVYKKLYSKEPWDYVLFHCRLAGPAGSICDENSQPYYDGAYNIALAHNGVASEFCNSKYDYSDTELLLRVLCDYGIPVRNLEYYSGVFIGTNQGVPFVVKGAEWTDLELIYREETNAWCFMSVGIYPLYKKPYAIVPIKRCVWTGHEVDSLYIEGLSHKHTSYRYSTWDNKSNSWVDKYDGPLHDTKLNMALVRQKDISEMTDDEWMLYQAQEEEEQAQGDISDEKWEQIKAGIDRGNFPPIPDSEG